MLCPYEETATAESRIAAHRSLIANHGFRRRQYGVQVLSRSQPRDSRRRPKRRAICGGSQAWASSRPRARRSISPARWRARSCAQRWRAFPALLSSWLFGARLVFSEDWGGVLCESMRGALPGKPGRQTAGASSRTPQEAGVGALPGLTSERDSSAASRAAPTPREEKGAGLRSLPASGQAE